MNPKLLALLTMIAGSLSLSAQTPETIEDALNGEVRRRELDKPGRIAALLELPKAFTTLIECSARTLAMPGDKGAADKATSATDKVKALLSALGVQDVDAACNELLSQMARAKDLMAAVPELEQMLDEQMAAENGDAMDDVAAALNVSVDTLDKWGVKGRPTPQQRLREKLLATGASQAEVAQMLGVSRQVVNRGTRGGGGAD